MSSTIKESLPPSQLWSHFLPSISPSMGRPMLSANTFPAAPTLATSDKPGTTMRLLLQDTQKTLETFSERLDKLFNNLDLSKNSLTSAGKVLEESHERAVEETRETVHIAKSEIEDAIKGVVKKDAFEHTQKQIASIEESLRDTNLKLTSIDQQIDKQGAGFITQMTSMERKLETKLDCISTHLQSVVNQHAQLLAALSAVATLTPLFQVMHSMPQHHTSAVATVTSATQAAREFNPIATSSPSIRGAKRPLDDMPTHSLSNVDFKRSRVEPGETQSINIPLSPSEDSIRPCNSQPAPVLDNREYTARTLDSTSLQFKLAQAAPSSDRTLYSSSPRRPEDACSQRVDCQDASPIQHEQARGTISELCRTLDELRPMSGKRRNNTKSAKSLQSPHSQSIIPPIHQSRVMVSSSGMESSHTTDQHVENRESSCSLSSAIQTRSHTKHTRDGQKDSPIVSKARAQRFPAPQKRRTPRKKTRSAKVENAIASPSASPGSEEADISRPLPVAVSEPHQPPIEPTTSIPLSQTQQASQDAEGVQASVPFGVLKAMEEDEGNVSVDIGFIWESLPEFSDEEVL